MRRTLGWVALVLGFCLIALAPLQRFYIADRLIGVPRNIYQKSTLEATQASYFDVKTGRMRNGVRLVATNTIRGDAEASKGDTTMVDSFTVLEDPATGAELDVQVLRAALNRKTSELTNCCGAAVGEDTSVRQSGLAVTWPIADVRKKTYHYFDYTTKRTWPMNFVGVEKVQGIDAYKFVMHVQPTSLAQLDGFSGRMLGLDGKKTYRVNRVYESTVTTWVDPRTGSPINRRQQVTTTLRTADGAGSMVAASFDLRMIPGSQRDLADNSRGKAQMISAITVVGPVASLCLGAVLILAGLVLIRRRRMPLPKASGEGVQATPPARGRPRHRHA